MTGDQSANEIDQLLTKLESLDDRDHRIALLEFEVMNLTQTLWDYCIDEARKLNDMKQIRRPACPVDGRMALYRIHTAFAHGGKHCWEDNTNKKPAPAQKPAETPKEVPDPTRKQRIAATAMATAIKGLPARAAQKMAHRFLSNACAEAWDQACKATLDRTKATGKPSRPANPYVKDSS